MATLTPPPSPPHHDDDTKENLSPEQTAAQRQHLMLEMFKMSYGRLLYETVEDGKPVCRVLNQMPYVLGVFSKDDGRKKPMNMLSLFCCQKVVLMDECHEVVLYKSPTSYDFYTFPGAFDEPEVVDYDDEVAKQNKYDDVLTKDHIFPTGHLVCFIDKDSAEFLAGWKYRLETETHVFDQIIEGQTDDAEQPLFVQIQGPEQRIEPSRGRVDEDRVTQQHAAVLAVVQQYLGAVEQGRRL